jgi:hypothetical protein
LSAEEGRKFRLGINDLIRTSYNNADYNEFLKVLLAHCDPNITFIAPQNAFRAYGVYAIVGYFILISEIFPDSMWKFIEKRTATFKMPTSSLSSSASSPTPPSTTEVVEIIDKFSGTRVLDKPAIAFYKQILEEGLIQPHRPYSVLELTQIIGTKLCDAEVAPTASSTSSIGLGQEVTFITETSFTFDLQTNKILIWNYNILAVQTH